jgi:hypothetical protein
MKGLVTGENKDVARDILVEQTKCMQGELLTLCEIALPPGQQLNALKNQVNSVIWRKTGHIEETLFGYDVITPEPLSDPVA